MRISYSVLKDIYYNTGNKRRVKEILTNATARHNYVSDLLHDYADNYYTHSGKEIIDMSSYKLGISQLVNSK